MLINKKEAIRYLGYGKNTPDEATMEMIDRCIEQVMNISSPRHIYRVYELSVNGQEISAGGINFKSRNLSKNLTGCDKIIFFAATLGSGPDMLMNRYQKLSISMAAVLQAVAAAAIESYCDECQRKIEAEMKLHGYYVRPRFSPGYGDLSIEVQRDFTSVLNTYKSIGVTLSDGNVMIPEKSVTAFMGLSREDSKCHIQGCELCNKKDCSFRRNS